MSYKIFILLVFSLVSSKESTRSKTDAEIQKISLYNSKLAEHIPVHATSPANINRFLDENVDSIKTCAKCAISGQRWQDNKCVKISNKVSSQTIFDFMD